VKTTGIFSLHKFEISFKNYDEPIYLIPFGDIHRSAPLCHIEQWLNFLAWAKTKKNCYFLGMGDYDDLASTSERPFLTHSPLHDSTLQTLEKLYRENTQKLIDELSFMKDKLVGFLEGNHYAELQSGLSTTQLMAEALNCKYLGVSSFIRLILRKEGGHKGYTHKIDLWVHHGRGGGRTSGASINKVEQMVMSADADIYLMGHDHKKKVDMVSRLYLTDRHKKGVHLRKKDILLGRTGSFLRGYVDGEVSYVADGAYTPANLGVIKIEMTPKRMQKDNEERRYVSLHASI